MEKISFFSYKGGAGRSSVAYNTIPLIAKKLGASADHPVIVIDMDIDSAGMTFLLKKESESDKKGSYMVHELLSGVIPGVRDVPEEIPLKEHALFRSLMPVGHEYGVEDDESILFIGAEPGAGIDGTDTYDRAGNPLARFQKLCKLYGCKAIIFDTPTGDQLTARWSLSVSNKIVCCMRITKQFTVGTINYLVRKGPTYEDKTFYIVPNAVPQESITVDGEVYSIDTTRENIKNNIARNKDKFGSNNINQDMIDGYNFGIPEVKRFKIKEGILYKLKELQPDEKVALDCYSKLCDIIVGE